MRLYLPMTLPALARAVAEGSATAPYAFAVTARLRQASLGTDDPEDLEFLAFSAAATASLVLLAADPGSPTRRVVLSADVADGGVVEADDSAEAGRVSLTAPLALSDVVAVHVDDESFAARVAALLARASPAILLGDEAAADPETEALLDEVAGEPLQWFASQEIALIMDQPEPRTATGLSG